MAPGMAMGQGSKLDVEMNPTATNGDLRSTTNFRVAPFYYKTSPKIKTEELAIIGVALVVAIFMWRY